MSREIEELIPALPRGVTLPPGAVRIQLDGENAADLGEAIRLLGLIVSRRLAIDAAERQRLEVARGTAIAARNRAQLALSQEIEKAAARAEAEKTRKFTPAQPPATEDPEAAVASPGPTYGPIAPESVRGESLPPAG